MSMSMITPALFLSNIVPNALESPLPTRSLDFEASSSQYLSMSDTNFGAFDRDKGTFSFWAKAETFTGSQGNIITQAVASQFCFALGFNSAGSVRFDLSTNGSTFDGVLVTNATYSSGTWYHIKALYDMQNATAGNRMRLWVAGSEISSFSVDSNPPQTSLFNSTAAIEIGRNSDDSAYYDGLLDQPGYFSGVDAPIAQLISGGSPVDVRGVSGLYSLLHTTAASTLEDDYVLATNWTNNNGVIKSTDVPV